VPAVNNAEARSILTRAKRLVVKVGSRVLVQTSGRPDTRRIRELVRQLAALRKDGREVVLVTSGAIGAGMQALGMTTRPTHLPDLQMAAAVGQSCLMAMYGELFAAQGCIVGQVLLTHGDLKDRVRHLNARNTMMRLLDRGIIPVVNENDVVAVDEIKFGDNDLLASLVALLIDADALILLTTVDGLREPGTNGRTKRVALLEGITKDTLALAKGKGSQLSTGGMASKLQSAAMVLHNGIHVAIANGRTPGVIDRLIRGEDTGTFAPGAASKDEALHGRRRWIAFFHRAKGAVVVDDGARDAILKKGRSLLPIGIRNVEGTFEQGCVVDIRTLDGAVIGKGLTEYGSNELRLIRGKKTAEIEALLGVQDYAEVVHRDNMVIG
jgi:glutamate 5-kinase